MNKYKYVATSQDGKTIKGTFVAENENEMKEMLLKAGYFVSRYRQVSTKELSQFFSLSSKIKVTELFQFCNQFSAMISAGISIVEAVQVSSEQSFSIKLKSALKAIQEDMKQGVSLSDAMAKHPKIFPPFFSSMVYIGEMAGCLDRVLITVAQYYELENKTKKKIRSSLAYPIILSLMLVAVVIVMMVFVIPTFISSFQQMGTPMPALTLGIFDASIFFQENILYILLVLFALITASILLKLLPSVQFFYDRMKVTLPVFKKINMSVFTSRFCRSLGLLLSSGADTLTSLETMQKTINNKYLQKKFTRVIDDVRMGMALSSALAVEMKLSSILIQMIIVGEKTGELDSVLVKTAPFFDDETEKSLNLITTIVQPTVMILLGAAVAILFVAIYSPILESIKSLQA